MKISAHSFFHSFFLLFVLYTMMETEHEMVNKATSGFSET